MIWELSYKADPRAWEVADRHYNRQKPGTPQFVPPGRALVLYTETETVRAFWVTSYPFAQYVRHAWAGAWVCSAFRNEGAGVASEMIRDAVAATRVYFGEPPELGFNFSQAAAWAVDASQGTAKYKRHVNFSDAVFACCAFLRRSAADPLPLLRRRLLSLRPGRTAPRPKITGNRISACYASAR